MKSIRVLYSFGPLSSESSPYVRMLVEELPEDIVPVFFDWKCAFTSRVDVFHIHWPEALVKRTTSKATFVRSAALLLLVLRLRFRGTRIVRTVHNSVPHEVPRLAERLCYRGLARLTDDVIVLEQCWLEEYPSATVIPHPILSLLPSVPARAPHGRPRILSFGLVRQYKGIEDLIEAWAPIQESCDLRIVGRALESAYGERISAMLRASGPRASGDLRHLEDEELSAEFAAADLCIFAYREMQNSGAVLLSVGMGMPTLVPRSPMGDHYASQFPELVKTFDHPLTSQQIREAVAWSQRVPKVQVTVDESRSRQALAREHASLYRGSWRQGKGGNGYDG